MQTAKSLVFGVFSKTRCFGVDVYMVYNIV